MGLDVSANVIVGFKATDVISQHKRQKVVTKYDVNTGAPIQKMEEESFIIFNEKEYPDIYSIEGLDVHSSDSESDDLDDIIFGESINETGSHRHSEYSCEVDLVVVTTELNKLKEKYPNLCPKVYVSMSMSY